MPLVRQALLFSGEHIHVAVWPTVHEMHHIASCHYVFEARCFVLAADLIMRVEDLPPELTTPAELDGRPDGLLLSGGSAVIGPDEQYIAGLTFDEETILTAETDLSQIDKEKMALDVSGHYNRPDVFDLGIKKSSRN